MDRYTLGLALFDYLPVVAGGLGMYFVCRYCSIVGTRVAAWVYLVPLLIFTGGFLKATWKTIVVVTGTNIVWMSDQLFFFLASGYILVAALVLLSLRAHAREKSLSPGWWRLPAALALTIVIAALFLRATMEGRGWNFLLLGVLSVANLLIFVRLIAHAGGRRNWLSATGFFASLTIGYVLVGLARIEDQTLELQWIEESLNFVSNSILAFSAWYLIKNFPAKERAG